MRWGAIATLAAAVAASIAACSSSYGSGEDEGDPPAEASVGDGQSSTTDADAKDSEVTDPDAGGPCDATFCDDFERQTLLGPWSLSKIDGQGELLLVDADAGRVLFADRLAGGVSLTPSAYLYKSLGAGTSVRYALDLDVVGTVPNYAILCSIEVGQGNGANGSVVVQKIGSGAFTAASNYQYTDGGSGYVITPFSSPFAEGVWQRLEILLELSATPPSRYTVKLNGATVVDTTTLGLLATPATVGVRAGLWTTDGVDDSFRVRVDNVRVDVTP